MGQRGKRVKDQLPNLPIDATWVGSSEFSICFPGGVYGKRCASQWENWSIATCFCKTGGWGGKLASVWPTETMGEVEV